MHYSKRKGPFLNLKPVILASGSPRRKSLLSSLGIKFSIQKKHAPEPAHVKGQDPVEYALGNARLKAINVPGSFVISADTIVVLGDDVIGKPKDRQDAIYMLGRLCGKRHSVITACCITSDTGRQIEFCIRSDVWLSAQPLSVITAYVETGEPMDKAGAYAIQGIGAFMVERISGSYTNVVGLPLAELTERLVALEAIAHYEYKS